MRSSQQVENDIKNIITELFNTEVTWEHFMTLATLTVTLETYLSAWELARYVEQNVDSN